MSHTSRTHLRNASACGAWRGAHVKTRGQSSRGVQVKSRPVCRRGRWRGRSRRRVNRMRLFPQPFSPLFLASELVKDSVLLVCRAPKGPWKFVNLRVGGNQGLEYPKCFNVYILHMCNNRHQYKESGAWTCQSLLKNNNNITIKTTE